MNCDKKLAMAIEPDCTNPMVGGLEADGCIMNRADIDFDACERDEENPNLITTLALKSGMRGFPIYQQGNSPFTGSNVAFTAGTFMNKFTKQVNFMVADHSAECCNKIIDQLANGTFVVVMKNKYVGSDKKSKFEVFGYEAGLKQTEGSRDPYSEDTDGGWAVALQEVAPTSGLFLYTGDMSSTETAFQSLMISD